MARSISESTLERYTNFGDLLRLLRRRAGITQIELSIAVGYSDSQISRLEQNLRLPDISVLQARFVPALNLENEPQAVSRLLDLAAAVRREDAPVLGVCPYKGLQFFDETDADLFTGREELTDKLVARVLTLAADGSTSSERFLSVVGASGSGKSSLVRAGLVPALRWQAASANWPIHVLTPTAHPLESLAINLLRDHSLASVAALVDDMAREPRSLGLFLKRELKSTDGKHILLVIDQFEEVFALCRSEDERSAFIENLMTAVGDPSGPALVVITLRADFYAQCAGYPRLRQALTRQQEFIGSMTTDELRRAIEEPARRGQWEFEDGLVDLLLRDVGQEPGALPLLSHALLETWQRRRGRSLTLSGYAASGGVRGGIAETAESVFADRFNHRQQDIARRIFLRLTELGDESAAGDTRRRAAFNELILKPEEAEETLSVLKTLADARLIITNTDAAEVAHEALIREWPTLRGWLEDNREGLHLHRHLTEAAQEWLSHGREPDALYRGVRLAQAREWAASHAEEINALEKEYLEASLAEAERESAERDAQRQRELEAARKLAHAEERRANELRKRAWYLAGALALALGLAFAAIYLGSQARQAAATALGQQRMAFSRELAAASISNLTVDPERSILLSLEALKLADTLEAENALHMAVQTSRIRRTLQVNSEEVVGIDFSRDGKRLAASGGGDGSARIWDLESGEVLAILAGHTGVINMVMYNPDGTRLATASDDGTVKVWDAQTSRELLSLSGHSGYVAAVAFSPNGKIIATVGEDKTTRLWDAHSGRTLRVIRGHSQMIRGVAFSPDGARLVTASDDQTAIIWDANAGQMILTLSGHSGPILGTAYSPDGKYIATASEDGTAKIWDAVSGKELHTLTGHTGIVQGIAFSPEGDLLATGSYDGRVIIWNIPSGKVKYTLSGRAAQIYRVAFSPNGLQVASANSDGTAQLWDVSPGKELMTFAAQSGAVFSVFYSPDGKRLLTTGEDGTAALWDAHTGKALLWLRGHAGPVIRAVFNRDGTRVATASDDLTARLWDATTAKELVRFSGHMQGTNRSPFSGVLDVAFSPDETRLVTAGSDSTIRIWDAASGVELMQLNGHTQRVNSVAYSPNGARLASGSDDTTIKIWDPASGKEIMTLRGHTLRVWRVIYSPDGAWLVSSGTDGAVILWDAETGRQIRVFSGHTSTIVSVVFNPQQDRLASASMDGSVKIWDALSGQVLLTLKDHNAGVIGAAFSPDGALLATSSENGTVRVEFMEIQDLIDLAKLRLTRSLTIWECQQYLHVEACPDGP